MTYLGSLPCFKCGELMPPSSKTSICSKCQSPAPEPTSKVPPRVLTYFCGECEQAHFTRSKKNDCPYCHSGDDFSEIITIERHENILREERAKVWDIAATTIANSDIEDRFGIEETYNLFKAQAAASRAQPSGLEDGK